MSLVLLELVVENMDVIIEIMMIHLFIFHMQ